MSEKAVDGAWEEADHYMKEVDGAWESCEAACKPVDGAWEKVWESYTPIIKDGVWMLADTNAQYGETYADSNESDTEYSGYLNAGSSLVYGELKVEEDETGESRGVLMYNVWHLTLDRIPKAFYIEGWIDGGLSSYGYMYINNSKNDDDDVKYQLGHDKLGAINFNNGAWIEFDATAYPGSVLNIDFYLNSWYEQISVDADYYYQKAYSTWIPAWKINNLWVKFEDSTSVDESESEDNKYYFVQDESIVRACTVDFGNTDEDLGTTTQTPDKAIWDIEPSYNSTYEEYEVSVDFDLLFPGLTTDTPSGTSMHIGSFKSVVIEYSLTTDGEDDWGDKYCYIRDEFENQTLGELSIGTNMTSTIATTADTYMERIGFFISVGGPNTGAYRLVIHNLYLE